MKKKISIILFSVLYLTCCNNDLAEKIDYQHGYHDTGLFEYALLINGQYVDCQVIMSNGRDYMDGEVDHNEVYCTIPELADYNLVAKFKLSKYARAVVENLRQVSEETVNDFSQEVVYAIHSQKAGKKDYYTIKIIIQ